MTVNYKRLFWIFTAVFAVGLCAALPLIVNLILYSIDPSTHFYYDNAKLVPVANTLLVVLTVLLIIPFFAKRSGAPAGFYNSKLTVVSIFSALLGIALCVSSAYGIIEAFLGKGAGPFVTGLTGILAAVFFFSFAESKLRGKKVNLRLIALLPVLWGVVGLISTFMSLTQIANISEYLYVVLQMVFSILFLYYHARLIGGETNRHELNGVYAFGLPCAFYGFAATLPNYIAHAINHGRGRLPQPNDFVLLAMSVYILVLLVSMLVQKSGPAQSVTAPAETESTAAEVEDKSAPNDTEGNETES